MNASRSYDSARCSTHEACVNDLPPQVVGQLRQ